MKLLLPIYNLTVICFALCANYVFASTVETPVLGVFSGEIPANSEAYIGITTTRAPVFEGVVESVNAGSSKIVAGGEPAWSANQFVFADGVQPEHYYLKITSGELEGAWFDISSNDAFSVTIEIGAGEIQKIAKGDSFQIIPHWTMATLFPDGGGFSKATKISATASATMLYKYTSYGTDGLEYPIGVNSASMQRFYYRERGDINNWCDADKKDASNVLVEPNAVFVAVQPDNSCTYSYSGNIPMCATSFVLFTLDNGEGVQDQEMYIPLPSAVDFELNELTSTLIDSGAFTPSTSVASSPVDIIYAYENKSSGLNLTPDNSFFYRKRGATNKWLDKDKQDAQTYKLSAGTVLVFRKKATDEEFSIRCKFTPNYISK